MLICALKAQINDSNIEKKLIGMSPLHLIFNF